VDDIIVLAVNDCFAMRAWEKTFETDKVGRKGGREGGRDGGREGGMEGG